MRLTVLGNTGDYLAPLSGGSGYLLEATGVRVLLDCGGGVRDALRALGGSGGKLDAVVLSHFHFDHVQDFVTIGALVGPDTRVFVPPGEKRRVELLAQAYVFRGAWDIGGLTEVDFAGSYEVGDLTLRFAPTQHSAPSMATRAEAPSGARFVYASDAAPSDALRDAADGADLLLMHALLPTVEPESNHARIHSTAQTAARLAKSAGAHRLLLSHRFHESTDEDMLREARASFENVDLAKDGANHDV